MKSVIVEGSARHVHLSKEDLEILFGTGYELRHKRDLSQPGEFLTEEKVRVEGSRGAIDRVSVLGPCRKATQVEVSMTDTRKLGVEAPVRMSGDLQGSAPCRLIGPSGSVELKEGCVVAKRHIHVTTADAALLGIEGKETISLKLSGERGLIFDEIAVRVSDKFATRVHLDYDEMNAAGLTGDAEGVVLP